MAMISFLVGFVIGAISGAIGFWYYVTKKNAAAAKVTLKAP
jgi:hypothetical protein